MCGCFAIARCVECGALWLPADVERWPAYLTDDEPAEVVFYCPACAEREFKKLGVLSASRMTHAYRL